MPSGTVHCTCKENQYECEIHVACDDPCGAFRDPNTFPEAIETMIHYREHKLYGGCSHGS